MGRDAGERGKERKRGSEAELWRRELTHEEHSSISEADSNLLHLLGTNIVNSHQKYFLVRI